MLKNAYCLEKTAKTLQRRGLQTPVCLRRLRIRPPDLSVVTPTYYYNYVEFVSSAKCVLLAFKKGQNSSTVNSAFASSALLQLFSLQTLSILLTGAQEYFLPQGA